MSKGSSQLLKVGTAFSVFRPASAYRPIPRLPRLSFSPPFIVPLHLPKRSPFNMNLFEQQANEFAGRHIGPDESETSGMLAAIGVRSLDELIDRTIPSAIRTNKPLN